MSVIESNIPDSVKVGDFTCLGKDTVIGEGTRISSHCNIYSATIGERCVIGSMVEIQKNAVIGNDCRISSHSFVCSNVIIGNNVFVAHSVNFTNDLFENGEVHFDSNDWATTIINDDVKIGSGSVILPVKIGRGAVIGAGSVVTSDIPEYAVAYGNPARVKYFLKDKK